MTEEEIINKVKELFNQKHGSRSIAKILGITRDKVQKIYKVLGVYNIGRKTPRQPIPSEKFCKGGCAQIKKIDEFRKRVKSDRTSYEAYCLICEKEINKKHCKQRYENNPQWWVDYRNENQENINKYQKDRRNSDINFKLRGNMSNRILACLKRNDGSKDKNSYLKYLNYTIDELRIHIESQFEWWMTWDNIGRYELNSWDDNDSKTWTWQVDHIKPASDFTYTSMADPEFKECWALSNLRPLSAKQNLIDGCRRIRHNSTSN